jgi:glycosyltransferase involved in cell wall biosynthesis
MTKIAPPLCFVSSHPIQYQSPIFKEIFKKNKNFYVIFENNFNKNLTFWDKDFNKKIKWSNDLIKNYNFYIFKKNFFLLSNIFSYISFLKEKKIEIVIISGWNSFFYILTIVLAKILRIKIALRCENNYLNCSPFVKIVKKLIFFYFFKLFYKFYAIGQKNYQMYIDTAVNKKKILRTPYCVDENFFSKYKLNKKKLIEIKKKFFNKNIKTYLFVGKIIERKGFRLLINLAKRLIKNKKIKFKVQIIIIGNGRKSFFLKNQIQKHKLTNVKFIEFQSQKRLIYFYYLSDYLILPSKYETWGLVANESMSMGTPCIVSDSCGCANDLVLNNNGYIFKNQNENHLYSIFIKSFNNKKYKFLKINSLQRVKNYSVKKTVSEIIR